MTDLLQTAVNTGTGRAAQIGRPVAGKTGTTSSNKDGWFLGFSSGITTGVWMGRDDAKRGPRPAGRHARRRAPSPIHGPRVANRPVEQFETEVELPEWQLEPDEEAWFGAPDNGDASSIADGNPIDRRRSSRRRRPRRTRPSRAATGRGTARPGLASTARSTGRRPRARPRRDARPRSEPPRATPARLGRRRRPAIAVRPSRPTR